MKLYAKNGINRKYYKYVWETESSTFTPTGKITSTGAWENPQFAFDGNSETCTRCGNASDYIDIVLDNPIKITRFDISGNWIQAVSVSVGMIIYTVENDVETLIAETNDPSRSATYTAYATFNEIETNHLRFRLKARNAQYVVDPSYPTRTREITVTGVRRSTIEATIDDYDFYEDNIICFLPKKTVTKYWKYGDYTVDWQQPILTSLNQYGLVSSAYGTTVLPLFDGNENTTFQVYGDNKIKWEFPQPISVSKVVLKGQYVRAGARATDIYVYTEIDGVLMQLAIGSGSSNIDTYTSTANIDNVIVDNLVFYGYRWSGGYEPLLRELYITAKQREALPAAEDDYDFITQKDVYYISET